MPIDSANSYSIAMQNFLTEASIYDLYIGFGVGKVGYADKSTRVAKDTANVSSWIERVSRDNIFGVWDRTNWAAGTAYLPWDYTNPDATRSVVYNEADGGIYLCVGNGTNRLSSIGGIRAKTAPSGSANTIITTACGLEWIKINSTTAISENYVKILGVESTIYFKGSTFDATGPTGGFGASGITFGTCCLYAQENWTDPLGKTYIAGEIVSAYKVPNRWTCEYFGRRLGFHAEFKGSVTTTELGGFFNVTGSSGCTPCAATLANYTPFSLYNSGGSAGYSSSDSTKTNTEILSAYNQGTILGVLWNDDPTINYYCDVENPEVNVFVNPDGNIGTAKVYLKTEYVGGPYGFKVIGAYVMDRLTASGIVFAETPSLKTGTLTASSGDASVCLANIQFNLSPLTSTGENYMSVFDLLRVNKIGVSVDLTDAKITSLFGSNNYDFKSVFVASGIKNATGYRVASDGKINYIKQYKTSATATITALSGSGTLDNLDSELYISDINETISTDYLDNKTSATKTIGSGSRAYTPGKPTGSYTVSFSSLDAVSGTVELSSYDAFSLGTGGVYLAEIQGATGISFTVSAITNSNIDLSDAKIYAVADTVAAQSSTNTLTAILNI